MDAVVIDGNSLSIESIAAVAGGATVELTRDADVRARLERSREVIAKAIRNKEEIYGVTTLFGAMADQYVGPERLADVQKLALWQHKSATGPRLRDEDVRAAMLLRANSLIKGASGIRLEIIERFVTFLNARAHPHVYQRGSIGASGDLVPLSYIGASVIGLDPAFLVDVEGQTLDSHTVLRRLGLEPLTLEPKEGLALNNGTGACTGVAANCTAKALDLTALALAVHALYAQALLATDQSYEPFIHAVKPHPGQIWTAQQMSRLVQGSKTIRSEAAGERGHRKGALIQDRYSLRCLPQYIGPIIDGLATVARQITVESNSANDNPLIDVERGEILHTGNFLAQYTGIAMDQLRYHVGLLAKHLDVQIALLMTPEFSYGLPASLVGNTEAGINVGFKSLQVAGNCMMPVMSFYGQSIVDRFPTHAEQFNQNINSQAMGSANLARETLDVLDHFMAVALMCGVQAVELRAKITHDTYDATTILSPATQPLYRAARTVAFGPPDASRPLHWNDMDEFIQPKIEALLASISAGGDVMRSTRSVRDPLYDFVSERQS
jgi:phenylalanine ammonia-lyase